MNLSIDIPDHLYTTALRVLADLLDGAGDTEPAADSADTDGVDTTASWQIEGLLPNAWDDEFQRLSTLYASITLLARKLLDLLVDEHAAIHQDELVDRLGLGGTSALAGTVGHITKTAESLGRPSPIQRDANRKTYHVGGNLAEALRQARLWACPEILVTDEHWSIDNPPRSYIHLFQVFGKSYRYVSEHPKRYLMLPRQHVTDASPAFYTTRDALLTAHGEAFDEVESLVIEFAPDHDHDVLRGRLAGEDVLGPWGEEQYDLQPLPPELGVEEMS